MRSNLFLVALLIFAGSSVSKALSVPRDQIPAYVGKINKALKEFSSGNVTCVSKQKPSVGYDHAFWDRRRLGEDLGLEVLDLSRVSGIFVDRLGNQPSILIVRDDKLRTRDMIFVSTTPDHKQILSIDVIPQNRVEHGEELEDLVAPPKKVSLPPYTEYKSYGWLFHCSQKPSP